MTSRAILLSVVLFAATLPGVAAAQTPRPNVLVIMSDDLNDDMMAFGHPIVRTPNIERLASRGVRFERAYAQFALCNPSRASMMTGLRPDRIRVYDLATHFRETVPDAVTLPQMFRRAGYYTARVGKIFHYGNPADIGTSGLDDAASWDHVVNPRGVDVDEGAAVSWAGPSRALGASLSYYASPEPDEAHTDGMVAAETIALLEKNRDRPFFLAAGFYRPHCPFIAPRKYFDMYDPGRVPVSEYSELLIRQSPTASRGVVWPVPLDEQREAVRAYYASISFMDAQVGRILEALERLGLARNTIVVFMSDHGYHLGDHGGLWMKQTLFERSTRTPLIFAGPGVTAAGQASRRVVELIDVFPTLAALATVAPPPELEGRSLAPLLTDPDAPWSRPALSQSRRPLAPLGGRSTGSARGRGAGRGAGGAAAPATGYAVRNERWRYIEWDDGRSGRELYDVAGDPDERTNLADDGAHAAVVAEMRALLAATRAGTSPPDGAR